MTLYLVHCITDDMAGLLLLLYTHDYVYSFIYVFIQSYTPLQNSFAWTVLSCLLQLPTTAVLCELYWFTCSCYSHLQDSLLHV